MTLLEWIVHGTRYDIPVPHVRNEGGRCFQTCTHMLIQKFWPGTTMSAQELDAITTSYGKIDRPKTLAWFARAGVTVRHIEPIDYRATLRSQREIRHPTPAQAAYTASIQEFLNCVSVHEDEPAIDDIERYIRRGYLVLCRVDNHVITRRKGVGPHAVIVRGYDRWSLYLNDPNRSEVRAVSKYRFERAWSSPCVVYKKLSALRRKR